MGRLGLQCREWIAGVDITGNGIAVARVQAGAGGRVRVTHAGYAELSANASDADIAHRLRKLWHEARMPTYTVCSCVNTGSLLLKHFSYRDLTHPELASALRIEAEESLQTPSESLVIDWHEVSRAGQSDDRPGLREGLLVVTNREEIDRQRRLLAAAGLYPVIIDVASLAVCNLWLHMRRADPTDPVIFVVNLVRHAANLVVLDHEGRVYPRTILTHFGSWAEAADYLVDNIVGQENYAVSKLKMHPVGKLLLTGEVPAGNALVESIRTATGHPVEHWTPLEDPRLQVARGARSVLEQPEIARRMTVCLGLALRGCES